MGTSIIMVNDVDYDVWVFQHGAVWCSLRKTRSMDIIGHRNPFGESSRKSHRALSDAFGQGVAGGATNGHVEVTAFEAPGECQNHSMKGALGWV